MVSDYGNFICGLSKFSIHTPKSANSKAKRDPSTLESAEMSSQKKVPQEHLVTGSSLKEVIQHLRE